jgi:hypothetical protein
MRDFLNLSADLARISEFYSRGDCNLAYKFIDRDLGKYGQTNIDINGQSIKDLLVELKNGGDLRQKSEKALSASLVLTHMASAVV